MISFSNSPRFAHVDGADLDRIEALVKLDQFTAEDVLWSEGQPSEWLGIVCEGTGELRVPGRDGEHVVARLAPGDLYGEVEMFADLPAGTRLVATSPMLTRICPKNPLRQEIRSHRRLATDLLFAFSRSMSEKIRTANATLLALRGAAPALSTPPPARSASGARPPHLGDDEATWLALLGRTLEAAPDETIVREGDTTRSFYVVQSGEVAVRKAIGAGDSHLLATLGPRDMFGMMSFLDGQPRSATVSAGPTPVRLAEIGPEALDKALELNFTVAFKFLGAMCQVIGRTFADTAREAARTNA